MSLSRDPFYFKGDWRDMFGRLRLMLRTDNLKRCHRVRLGHDVRFQSIGWLGVGWGWLRLGKGTCSVDNKTGRKLIQVTSGLDMRCIQEAMQATVGVDRTRAGFELIEQRLRRDITWAQQVI